MSAEPIGVLGAGWVGPATATGFADLGHHVTVRDVVPERVAALSAGGCRFTSRVSPSC
jgi:UDPglucose 6-dehydrogenase